MIPHSAVVTASAIGCLPDSWRYCSAAASPISILLTYLETGQVPRIPTAILTAGLMLLGFLSLASGLILDTVTHGRHEMKRLPYLSNAPAEE